MALWYLFNSTIKDVSSTNVALGHLLLEVTGKRLGEEEAQFDCFDGSYIWGFGDAWHQSYGKTQ